MLTESTRWSGDEKGKTTMDTKTLTSILRDSAARMGLNVRVRVGRGVYRGAAHVVVRTGATAADRVAVHDWISLVVESAGLRSTVGIYGASVEHTDSVAVYPAA